jgi:DNA-binding NarL/FixJ family response regulator
MIKVLIADDHPLVRRAVRRLLDSAANIRVVGEAAGGQQAIDAVHELDPDVVVMDISMPGLDGLTATARLQTLRARVRVVILSMHASPELVAQALQKGATGYLHKASAPRELVAAVVAASQGRRFLGAAIAGQPGV